ncbi:hypothetical protein Tcur_4865 [Thermomonospora curvata DSM 43183]|uniref:Uncharacterized protein n=1 Tax=Thermomonospora curvata (strain ATCC 19995 / DSM 43183 / JCM 3096 / KCTC 9072 / NBRC 15933 / NCIMB 10081 / Henssen B9) TaxID=471852 RepID=D1A868_THECD|nr:hypothetical protein Tcur_4865 [Thermomonospora curvata DSM 43183]
MEQCLPKFSCDVDQVQDPQYLLTRVGIWLPLEVYSEWPIMMPWAVRDLGCRRRYLADGRDMWSYPDENGYLVDDNSFIKGTVRSQRITSKRNQLLDGAKMAGGFVAAHIWRVVHHDLLASRIPRLYSFVPNLVWLPSEVAKATDREGGIYQRTLQAMSLAIYRKAAVKPALQNIVEAAWEMLPSPGISVSGIDFGELNWFSVNSSFYKTRKRHLHAVVDALESLESGRSLGRRVITSKYASGLPLVDTEARARLLRELRPFLVP